MAAFHSPASRRNLHLASPRLLPALLFVALGCGESAPPAKVAKTAPDPETAVNPPVAASPASTGKPAPAKPPAENVAQPAKPAKKPAPLEIPAFTPVELASRIDAIFDTYWKAEGVVPAAPATDEEFLRRAFLDLTGKIPSAAEARDFLDDKSAAKRGDLVARLLKNARFANHFAATLRDALIPGAITNPQFAGLVPPFEAWLRLRLADGVPYHKLVEEMLTAPVSADQPVVPGMRGRQPGPEAFALVHENKPEELAGSAARALLGVQVQCAQCHDHPFAEWKQEQFWSFATMFAAGTTSSSLLVSTANADLSLPIPEKNKKASARFLDGTPPEVSGADTLSRRNALVKWLVGPNPFFAKAAANRLWFHFTGRGIVHPVDDMRPENAGQPAEALELLAQQFRASGYDLKFLAEAIARSKPYGLSSRQSDKTQAEPVFFAKAQIRGMTPEQMFASLQRAGRPAAARPAADGDIAELFGNTERAQFLRMFSEPGERTGARGSLLQALHLMNGAAMASAVDPKSGAALRAALESPFLDDAQRLETLFLGTLSRRPTAAESKEFGEHVKAGAQAWSEVFWTLLNCSEFSVVP
ncbi:MAG TPA: DUF1549 domain-containing protein [Planctomycetia bacterium]|nr:DUF1549 domain-containing protein [Planctomycetia bacterium]